MVIPRPYLRLDITRRSRGLMVATALVVGACGGTAVTAEPGGSGDPDALRVVTTTTVLADMVRQVGGSRVMVDSLVPVGGEVHTFDPTPADLRRVSEADLVVMNGLGLDEWLGELVADSGTQAVTVAVGEDLEGVDYIEADGHGHEGDGHEDDGHEDEAVNPHLWLDVANGIAYAERIGEALAAADADHAADYESGAQAYVARLADLDAWVRETIAAVPADERRIVSFHEAFPYFARAYDLEIVGTVIDAPGQDPSAGEIAALVDAIRESGATAVLSEVQFGPELAETVAREAGVRVEAGLYNDSLGESPIDTYEAMIRWDVERIVVALTGRAP